MMINLVKGSVFFLVFSLILPLNGQSYVDSGLEKYYASEFEEAITFFDQGAEIKENFSKSYISKIFLYRGLSKFELLKDNGENAEALITPLDIYNDIEQSLVYANEWPSKVEEVENELFEILIDLADNSARIAKREKNLLQKIAVLNNRIEYLKIAIILNESGNSALYLGETYQEIADLYLHAKRDISSSKLIEENLVAALKYYEEARHVDPYSKDIIKSSLKLSKQLGDQERVEEYKELLKLAGG